MATTGPGTRGGALFDADGVEDSFRVSVVVPEPGAPAMTADEIARRLGGDPAALRAWRREEGGGLPALHGEFYLISQDGLAWVVAETTFFQATRPKIQRRLSAAATVHSLLYDSHFAGAEFCYARDGEIVTVVDPCYPDERNGSDPDALGDHLDEPYRLAEAGDSDWEPAAFALLLARCPATLSLEWWTGEHQMLSAAEVPDEASVPDPFRVLLEHADPKTRRRALFGALDEVLALTGMADESWVIQALADARTLYLRSDRHLSTYSALGEGEPPRLRRFRRAATERVDPHLAALYDAFEPRDQPQPASRLEYRTRPRRPGAPPMPDDPLWHRVQAGRALSLDPWTGEVIDLRGPAR